VFSAEGFPHTGFGLGSSWLMRICLSEQKKFCLVWLNGWRGCRSNGWRALLGTRWSGVTYSQYSTSLKYLIAFIKRIPHN